MSSSSALWWAQSSLSGCFSDHKRRSWGDLVRLCEARGKKQEGDGRLIVLWTNLQGPTVWINHVSLDLSWQTHQRHTGQLVGTPQPLFQIRLLPATTNQDGNGCNARTWGFKPMDGVRVRLHIVVTANWNVGKKTKKLNKLLHKILFSLMYLH